MTLAIEVSEVSFAYKKSRSRALDHVSFEVRQGTVCGIVGHNGAGKTTLLLLLAGCKTPEAGTLTVLGRPADDRSLMPRVGALTDRFRFYPSFTVSDVLSIFSRLYRLGGSRAEEVIEMFGLGPHMNKPVKELSSGLVKRLAIAVAGINDPPLLLLDEPFAGLDPASVEVLIEAIRTWRTAGRTVVLCSHDLPELEHVADSVVALARGRVLAAGSIGQLIDDLGIEKTAVITTDDGTRRGVPLETAALAAVFRDLEAERRTVTYVGVEGGSLAEVYRRLHQQHQ